MKNNGFVLSDGDAAFKQKIGAAANEAIKILSRDMEKYSSGALYPAAYKNGHYEAVVNGDLKNNAWQEGFYTGQLWLAYEISHEEKFEELAEKNVADFAERMENNFHIDWHHDTGFLYTPSCVAAYKLTGNTLAREAALSAAYSLQRRFRPRGEFIQSMGFELEKENYRFIIDTMMNLPLLFWAADETGKSVYREKAVKHAETTRKYILRDDGSTYHHFLMDFETAGPKGGLTLQGAGNDSCWSRGQAWMVYGSALMYANTGDSSWIETFDKVTDYFTAHLPENGIPNWDFSVFGTEDNDRDASAGMIAACGIMEMARLTEQGEKMRGYIAAAKKMLLSAVCEYAVAANEGDEGLMRGVMPAKLLGMTEPCAPYGDYFYLEALVRAMGNWEKYW